VNDASGQAGCSFELDERSVFDADAERMNVIGALLFRLVHQLVGALEQLLRELPCAIGRRSATSLSMRQTMPTSTRHPVSGEPRIVAGPVVALDRFAEAFGDDPRGAALVEIGNEKAEFVAPEPRVQILTSACTSTASCAIKSSERTCSRSSRATRIDNLVARRVAERIVVPLERIDIDQADGAPAPTLLERQETPRPAR
jgi:hypothetical protein